VSSSVLFGEHPGLLALEDSREPLHFYLTAISLSVFGNTPGSLRLPYVMCSLILVGIVGLLARELFDRKIGWLTAMLCACTVWPMYLGRYGTRSVVFALIIALAIYFAVRALGRRSLSIWIAAGLCFGVSHYTYTVNLFVIPAIIFIVVGMVTIVL
jgi:4-amino-4-deoxy-L-arabinose transferase-like glycosyltransferase